MKKQLKFILMSLLLISFGAQAQTIDPPYSAGTGIWIQQVGTLYPSNPTSATLYYTLYSKENRVKSVDYYYDGNGYLQLSNKVTICRTTDGLVGADGIVHHPDNDLLIADNDFKDKINVLKEFIDENDIANYSKLKQYYYASNTLNYNSDYIGDSVLIFAHDLIEQKPAYENYILHALNEVEIGAQFHTNLENRIYNFDLSIEEKIKDIQKKLDLFEELPKQNFRINKTLIIDFGNFEDDYEIKHDFKDFNIAYYPSKNNEKTLELLEKLDAKILNLATLKLDLAKNTFNKNPKITYCVASTILLDAFDTNADFLLVDTIEDFYIFDYNRKQIEKISGREIILPVIYINELQKLASGKHDEARKTLEKHQINPEII